MLSGDKGQDSKLSGSGYPAVRSDGIGTDAGSEWILDNRIDWRAQVDPSLLGIDKITRNNPECSKRQTTIYLSATPIILKFFLCGMFIGDIRTFQFPFLHVYDP
ncbi:hypothetical protein N7517_003893 [Penicillium concentricum]|uniref:Uncharacterized protein n=1 Tax=Penicillium concentricum TaxID=293559 RepID=A0A9W9S4K1_9EURO|nr:uncharacterized protein N7517_003893 [Penicillium concentricum]KAJ5371887.1 hypothetical protein N7517_003893 [Penicillium concentricum]